MIPIPLPSEIFLKKTLDIFSHMVFTGGTMKSQGRPAVYHSLTYEELGEYVGAKALIPIKKNWLENLGFDFGEVSEKPQQPTVKEQLQEIKYEITEFDE